VPAVLAGTDLARRTTAREQRFLLGRVAARLRFRSALGETVAEEALREALAAALAVAEVGATPFGRAPEALVRRLGRALPRRGRRALEATARALVAAPPPDLDAWREAAALTADRAGLVLSGDLPSALGLVVRGAGPGAPDDDGSIRHAVRDHVHARALLAFAASEAHFTLRQKLRVAVA
jgi:hypothetical protein